MIASMTGFAERSFVSSSLRAKFAVKSLNHRFFDWSYKGAAIGDVENRLRILCQEKLHRGRVEVVLDLHFPDPSSWEVSINEGLLERILDALERASRHHGHHVPVTTDSLFRIPQVLELRRKDFSPAEAAFLERCFLRVLDDVIKARRAEGAKTAAQLRTYILNVRRSVAKLRRLIKRQPGAVRRKLRRKVREIAGPSSASPGRLDEEVAFLSQRYDLSEEIHRLTCHLDAADGLLRSRKSGPAGKMLDFLAQELTREANTLNSKSQDIGVTREGLFIKGEVESIRQQAQNVE